MSDHRMVGKIGRVTGSIEPGKVGEVLIPVRGSTEAFLARTDDESSIATGTRIVVLEYLPPRMVIVSAVP